MIKILLVEDEQEKKRLIVQAIHQSSSDLILVDVVDDVNEAKLKLKSKKYDLLILDINVPMRLGSKAEAGNGLEILRFLRMRNKNLHVPNHIIGMTAYDDGYDRAMEEFKNPLWRLIKFAYDQSQWQESLKLAIEQLVLQHQPPYQNDGSTFNIDLGIIVALDEVELEAILKLPVTWTKIEIPHDPSIYYKSTFSDGEKNLKVVVSAASHMGMSATAISATKLINTFRPKYLAMAGICAGVANKTNIGDILIADPIFDWASGKLTTNKITNKEEFLTAPYQWRLDERVRAAAKDMRGDTSILSQIKKDWDGKKPDCELNVLIDAVASGGSVLQRKEVIESLVNEHHKNLIGVEMEIFGLFSAAEYSTIPKPICFAAKSVCDFGDADKEKSFQPYAAYTSASFIYNFALKHLPLE